MHEQAMQLFLRVLDLEARARWARDQPAIADLTAGFAVERGLIDDDRATVAGLQLGDALAVLDQRYDLAGRGLGVITEELGRAQLLLQLEPQGLGRGLA